MKIKSQLIITLVFLMALTTHLSAADMDPRNDKIDNSPTLTTTTLTTTSLVTTTLTITEKNEFSENDKNPSLSPSITHENTRNLSVRNILHDISNSSIVNLTLQNTGIDDRFLREFANSPSIQSIRTLNLPNNNIGDEGAIAISRTDHLPNLEIVDLSDNHISGDGIFELFSSEKFVGKLRSLKLNNNFINDSMLEKIKDICIINKLEALYLQNPAPSPMNVLRKRIGDIGAQHIASAPSLSNLKILDLSGNEITSDGMASLLPVNPKALPKFELSNLGLSSTKIDDRALVYISLSPHKLVLANLSYNNFTKTGFEVLQTYITHCRKDTDKLTTLLLKKTNLGKGYYRGGFEEILKQKRIDLQFE